MGESGEPNDVASVNRGGDEAEYQQRIQELMNKIQEMEAEKRQAREEFGLQRAKMKDLFLQKENEFKALTAERVRLQAELEEVRQLSAVTLMNDLETQKRKYEEQIASLEQLVNETMEESSSSRSQLDVDMKRLQSTNERLEAELVEYRKTTTGSNEDRHADKDRSNDPPPIQMLTQVTKTFARKVLSELGADSSSNSSKDNLEDSMRKAQEDAEVLRSLVVPLEEEIVALKEKLRETDEQLRRYTGGKGTDEINLEVSNVENSPAKVVVDAEGNLQNSTRVVEEESLLVMSPSTPHESTSLDSHVSPHTQEKDLEVFLRSTPNIAPNGSAASSSSTGCNMCRNYEAGLQRAQQKTRELEKALERTKEDLTREHAFRQEMEVKWNEKKEQHKVQVIELQKKTATAEQILQGLQQTYTQTYQDVTQQLSRLQHDRVAIKKEIDKLQEENDKLVGKHSEHSDNLQNQIINLPNNVEELHELLLRRHEELIAAKVCAETQQAEADLLREELQIQQSQNSQLILDLQQLKELVIKRESDRKRIQGLESAEKQALEQVEDLKTELDKAHRETWRLEGITKTLQSRIASLQHDLGVSEQVQKDFVRLSQSLQVQLEGFRQPDTQVRWQHEDDVEECPSCHINFGSSSSRKQHCKHCGRIFCNTCLTHTVPSGPQQRLSRVCDVCHTLLVPNTAPYFSNEPPPTPD